jgi:replicative DNA helicase
VARLISDVAKSYLGVVEERQKGGGVDVVGIPTGFHRVDEMTGGLQPDTLTIVGGRPGMGKTAFAIQIALNVSRGDKRVIFYSLEMTAERIVNRLLASMTGIPGGRIVRGKLSGDELKKVKRAAEELREFKMAISDRSMTSDDITADVTELAERAEASGGPSLGLAIIDYVSLLRDPQRVNENERVGRISSNLRTLARPDQLNIPVVALVQLNRQADARENHVPSLSDIRDSGSIEQDAETVIFPFRPYYYALMEGSERLEEERDAKIVIAKNREGPSGATPAIFYPAQTTWRQDKPEPLEPKPVKGSLADRVKKGRDS